MRFHTSILILFTLTALLFTFGCTRYAREVNFLYSPVTHERNQTGEIYIVIPPNQITQSGEVKWSIGTVRNSDDVKIDEIFSPRSPGELLQAALGQELTAAGYTVITPSALPKTSARVLDLTSTKIVVDQVSRITDIKGTCQLELLLDVWKNGRLLSKLRYESRYSDTNIKDRDLLAKGILRDALQSTMSKAVPEIVSILEK